MSKRKSSGIDIESVHKKCYTSQMNTISIDHTTHEDIKRYLKALRGKQLGDNSSDIKFIVDNQEIVSHSEVLEILSNQRQLVRELIERDKQLAKLQKCPEANIFQMSGTTIPAFTALLQYLYNGKVNCDLNTGIDLAITANKLKFHPLVASIAQQLAHNLNDILSIETVDDLYSIAKSSSNKLLTQECGQFMDKNDIKLNAKFHWKRDINENDDQNVLTYSYSKPRYVNYIHFLLNITPEICFNVMVSNDRHNWTTVLRNEDIWSKFWNWVYFKEMRVKYVRIVCNDIQDNDMDFNIRSLRDDCFVCKRVNIDLNFDSKNILIPKHDIMKYPIPLTKQVYDETQKNGYTYVTSEASVREKEKFYYYHRVGDGKPLEFYLPQTCLIDSFRFRLWDLDEREYDFTVEVKNEEQDDDNWTFIKDGSDKVFRKRRSWQVISLGKLQPVRWIRIIGIKAPVHDPEFAVIHFECPPQKHK